MALKEAVQRECGAQVEVTMLASPVGEHKSNGMAERAVQEVQGQVRTLRDAFEARVPR